MPWWRQKEARMGRKRAYSDAWKSQVVEMPAAVGEVVEAMAAASGLSLDGAIRAALRLSAQASGVDLQPWVRPGRPANGAKRGALVGGDIRRISVKLHGEWPVHSLGSTVTDAVCGAVRLLQICGWSGETLRASAMRLSDQAQDADSAALAARIAAVKAKG